MKAKYYLQLEVRDGWSAVINFPLDPAEGCKDAVLVATVYVAVLKRDQGLNIWLGSLQFCQSGAQV